MPPDEPNDYGNEDYEDDSYDDERPDELPAEDEDGAPFQPPPPNRDDTGAVDDDLQADDNKLDNTHPITDTGIDSQELYDEGLPGATETHEPNPGDDVVGYDPPDQPTQNPS
jgi:hypothetical protein